MITLFGILSYNFILILSATYPSIFWYILFLNITIDIFEHTRRKNEQTKARRSRGMRRTFSYAAMTRRGVTKVCEVMALCIGETVCSKNYAIIQVHG